jgi:hypothetical protein
MSSLRLRRIFYRERSYQVIKFTGDALAIDFGDFISYGRTCSSQSDASTWHDFVRGPSQISAKGTPMLRCIVTTLLFATTCFAQDAPRMDQLVQYYVIQGQFMGAVLVARGNQVILSKGYAARRTG